MARKFLTHIDLNKNELQNAVMQQLASAPGSPVQGQIYYDTTNDNLYVYDGSGWVDLTVQGGGGSGDVVGPASSVDSEIALFDSTTGKLLKRATGSGIAKITSGVLSTATSGTDYAPATSGSSVLKGNGSGGFSNAILDDLSATATAAFSMNTQRITSVTDPSGAQDAATKNYVDNLVNGVSWKQAVRAATSAAGTLATGFENGDTIDGVVLATNDRILIKDQAAGAENGIYTVNASGAPTRAFDADTAAEIKQATVLVQEGTVNGDSTWTLTNDGAITLGTTALVFALQGIGSVPTASTTVQGKVELATQAEAQAKSDTARAVTPASLADFTRKVTVTVGDNSSTTLTATHNLNTADVIVQVRQASDDAVVECDIDTTGPNAVSLTFAVAPASSAIKVVVIG